MRIQEIDLLLELPGARPVIVAVEQGHVLTAARAQSVDDVPGRPDVRVAEDQADPIRMRLREN